MKSSVGAASLVLIAAVFLAVGWIGLTNPAVLLDPLGIQLPTHQAEVAARATAFSEARATYGGMHFALGLFFLGGVFLGRVRGIALTVAFVYLTGLVVGRGVSIALDGTPTYVAWLLLAIEAIAVVLVAGALWKRRRVARAAARAAGSAPAAPVAASRDAATAG